MIGCLLDLDAQVIRYSIDGHHLGVAFEAVAAGAEPDVGWTPAASLTKNSSARFNLGETEFSFPPPTGYISVVEAVGMGVAPIPAALTPSAAGSAAEGMEEAKGDDDGFEDDFLFIPARPTMLVRHPTQPKWAPVDNFPLLWGAAPADTGGGSSASADSQLASVCTGKYLWEFRIEATGGGLFGSGSSMAIGVCAVNSNLDRPSSPSDRPGVPVPGADSNSWSMFSSGQ